LEECSAEQLHDFDPRANDANKLLPNIHHLLCLKLPFSFFDLCRFLMLELNEDEKQTKANP